jgi:hypothetical protein
MPQLLVECQERADTSIRCSGPRVCLYAEIKLRTIRDRLFSGINKRPIYSIISRKEETEI